MDYSPCCQSHCCKYHGCKYGYDSHEGYACPVVDGVVQQDGLCEFCWHDGIKNLEELEIIFQLDRAGDELKVKAIHRGLTDLQNTVLATEEEKLMRKYLERMVDDLKRE